MTPNLIPLGLLGTNSEQTYFIQAPFRCTVRSVQATAGNSDIGDADTVTVKYSSTAVGVATFGSGIAAGAKATYVPDTTYADHVFDKADIITVVTSALDAAGDRIFVLLDLDPYAVGQLPA